MRYYFLIILVSLVANIMCFGAVAVQASAQEHITAVVNDEAVSRFDVTARMTLIMKSANMPDREDIKEKLLPQVVDMLIDERLKIQEATRLGIEVTDDEIKDNIANIAKQNKMKPSQFRQVLEKQDVPFDTMVSKVEAQIAWQKVIQRRLAPRVDIPDNQIAMTIERMEMSKGKKEYLVSEIFLPIENKKREGDVKQLAARLVQQMTAENARFAKLASQFSQSASAARGGDIGWVQESQLSQEIDAVISQMNEKELSRPIRSTNGYHIMLLRKERTISSETIPTAEQVRNKLGMEQLERLQRGYMLDLKTAAFIERRV